MKLTFKSTMHTSIVLAGSVAVLCATTSPSPLKAQSMDYGALEQLFKEPVTTSVDGSPQRVSDVPATMEIITAEEIRRSGAKDIPGVLRHVAGVDTLEWGNDDIDVSVRGYNQAYSSRVLVLMDGRQVYADDYGYTPWSSVPVELNAIRQIEIVKGPNSALFGFNAVGGVINIITYNPLYDKIDTAAVTGGTQALGAGSAVATQSFGGKAFMRLSAGGHLDNDFSTPVPASEYSVPRREEYREAVDLDTVIRINNKIQLEFEGNQSSTERSEMISSYQLYLARYAAESVKAHLAAESALGILKATVYTNWIKTAYAPLILGQPILTNNQVVVAQLEDTLRVGAHHTFRIAGEYRHNSEPTTTFTGANVHYNNFAAGGMWDWKINPAVSFTAALRIDHLILGRNGNLPPGSPFVNSDWDQTYTAPSFNSGLVWKPADADSIRILVSRGTLLPSLIASGALLIVSPSATFSGSPFVDPTEVTDYETGWDHNLLKRNLLFRTSVFHQNNIGLFSSSGSYMVTKGGLYVVGANIGTSSANGLEAGFKGTFLDHYRWGANYRIERIYDHFIPSAQNAAAYVDFQHTTPRSLMKSNLGWANVRWELDSYLQFQSANQGIQINVTKIGAQFLTPIAAFVSVDGRIAYNPRKWTTWSVSGQNLTHASQIQTSGPAVERRVLGTVIFNF